MSTQNKRFGFSRRIGVVIAATLVALCLFAAAFAFLFGGGGSAPSEGSASGAAAESAAATAGSVPGQAVQLSGETYEKDAELAVRFLDVGQGDATLLESHGHWLLIDGGAPSASRKIYATLEKLGVSHLDAVIATHPDADHIGGIAAALNYATCDSLYCSVDQSDSETFAHMVKYNERNSSGIVVPQNGDSFTLGDATVTFLRTQEVFFDSNNGSLVTRIDCGGASFLFPGDAENPAEQALLSDGANVSATVLHVGHHGSLTSTSAAFLAAVAPRCAVVSVGANDYGHPSERVMECIWDFGAAIYRTDQVGDITFELCDGSLTVTTTKTTSDAPTAPGKPKSASGVADSATEPGSATSGAASGGVSTSGNVSNGDSGDVSDSTSAALQEYVLNTNTMKFHYPSCSSVEKMKDKNKQIVEAMRDEVRSWGYDPCGICRP